MIIKRIICLANSRKLSGRCIAGREWTEVGAGAWIRPVSSRINQEVSEYERQYEDGSDPRVLDIIDVPVLKSLPQGWQTENWLLDPEIYWRKWGTFPLHDLSRLVNPDMSLWIDGESTWHGRNDCLPPAPTSSLAGSLQLIAVARVELAVFQPGRAFGNNKKRVQARFIHSGTNYALWVTDPGYEKAYLRKPNGIYKIDACYLTVSVGEPYNDRCYKLVATVFERGRRQ